MGKKEVITGEIPERYMKIGGVQGITYLYLLSECCVPLAEGQNPEKVIPFAQLDRIPEFINELKNIVSAIFADEPDVEGLLEKAVTLRNDLKDAATDIFAYQDIMKLHEYVLRRTRPVDAPAGRTINDEAEARDILSAVFRDATNAVINENISLCVAQLPLRMTKARYHDILMNELKIYADGPKSAFDRNMFLMRMSAGICDGPHQKLPAVEGFLDRLLQADLKTIDSETRQSFEKELSECIELLDDYKDVSELIVQALDHFMVYLYNYLYNYRDSSREAVLEILGLRSIVDEALESFEKGRREKMSSTVLDLFSKTEGIVDEEFEKIAKSLGHFLKSSTQEEDRELKPYLQRFLLCDKLLSQSYYADIEEDADAEEESASREDVEKAVEEFCRDLEVRSENDSRMMSRARMAATFANIPVFFTSRTEVMNYVLSSINGCRDAYEKEVSLELAKKAVM